MLFRILGIGVYGVLSLKVLGFRVGGLGISGCRVQGLGL